MESGTPFAVDSDGWTDVRNALDDSEKMAILSMGDGRVKNGSITEVGAENLYLGPAEEVSGQHIVIPGEIAGSFWNEGPLEQDSVFMTPEDKNSHNFYTGSREGYPVEIKLAPVSEDEHWHSHASKEVYAPKNGEVTLGLITDFGEMDYEEVTVRSGEVFVVPQYVQHQVIDSDEDAELAIVRYGDGDVAKFDVEGNSMYPWTEDVEFERRPYTQEMGEYGSVFSD